MEIENLRLDLERRTLAKKIKSEETASGYTFLELYLVKLKNNMTIQYNTRGIVSVYYLNNQFYDMSDENLIDVIYCIAQGRITEHLDNNTHFITVQVDGKEVYPTRYE